MKKNSILTGSIILLVLTIAYSSLEDFTIKIISLIALIVMWLVLTYMVFADTKRRNVSGLFVATTFFLGGIGGLIYYFNIFKEKDKSLKDKSYTESSNSSKKNILIFNSLLAFTFGLIFLVTLTWNRHSSDNVALSIIFGVLTLLSILGIIYAKRK